MSSVSDYPIGHGNSGQGNIRNVSSDNDKYNTADYLSWRRLHLSKSKLNNVTEMSSFMAGFAVVATVELQINDDDVHPPLLIAFAVTTSLLVGTCMAAIIIATCVLPHLESVAKTANISSADLSPHDKMIRLIDISWILTNSASLFLFTLDVILMCWIKYTFFSIGASIAATVIMAPVLLIILIFSVLFYRRIVKHQYKISYSKYEELEQMQKQLETAASLASMSYQGSLSSYHYGSPRSPRWLQRQQHQFTFDDGSPNVLTNGHEESYINNHPGNLPERQVVPIPMSDQLSPISPKRSPLYSSSFPPSVITV